MILGVLVARKSYPWIKYLSVLLIVAGVAIFMYKDKKGEQQGDGHWIGTGELLLVSIAMFKYC